MKTVIYLSPTATARMELEALQPAGPFRLILEHPSSRIVEYFDSSTAAIDRWVEIEAALMGARLHQGMTFAA